MTVSVLPRLIEGVSRKQVLPRAPADIQTIWDLYKYGIVRAFYSHISEP